MATEISSKKRGRGMAPALQAVAAIGLSATQPPTPALENRLNRDQELHLGR